MKKVSHLRIDHFYSEDQGHLFWKRLAKLGLTKSPQVWEHPGGAICKFLIPVNGGYLEFVSFRKAKKTQGHPGISLAIDGSLEKFSKTITPKLMPKFSHRNYEWKKEAKGRLPGWNFLTFKKRPKPINIWFTEYEATPGRKKKKRATGKLGSIEALEITVARKDQAFFFGLLGLKKVEPVEMSCGRILELRPGKRTRFEAVVISVPALDRWQGKGLKLAIWKGRPALRFENLNRRGWDVLFVEG